MTPPELDPVIHAPARLKIMIILARVRPASFKLLREDAALTPGNLNAHLAALEKAGYVETLPGFVELKPRTRYQITAAGSEALKRYCDALRGLLAGL